MAKASVTKIGPPTRRQNVDQAYLDALSLKLDSAIAVMQCVRAACKAWEADEEGEMRPHHVDDTLELAVEIVNEVANGLDSVAIAKHAEAVAGGAA